jgi:hypothetical protein
MKIRSGTTPEPRVLLPHYPKGAEFPGGGGGGTKQSGERGSRSRHRELRTRQQGDSCSPTGVAECVTEVPVELSPVKQQQQEQKTENVRERSQVATGERRCLPSDQQSPGQAGGEDWQ